MKSREKHHCVKARGIGVVESSRQKLENEAAAFVDAIATVLGVFEAVQSAAVLHGVVVRLHPRLTRSSVLMREI